LSLRIHPSRSLVALAALWLGLGIVASIFPRLGLVWVGLSALFAVVAFADALLSRAPHGLTLEREVPGSWAVGVAKEVHLKLTHQGSRTLQIMIYDHHPLDAVAEQLPLSVTLSPTQTARVPYRLRPVKRGDLHFGLTDARIVSPLRLWESRASLGAPSTVRVYPDFSAISGYALLATDNRLSQIGVLTRRRRGEGMDFHQLREYREGDSQRQIDWNATARMRKLITREYRDERDQQIMFLIDCGRRMSASDVSADHAATQSGAGRLTHFDHVLNAALLLGYVSARQGDAVGFMTFATPEPRFCAPRKTGAAVQMLLNNLYDVQPGLNIPDYQAAATELSTRLTRRAFVIVLTNLRDEDDDSLASALKLLGSRHLVMFASLREPVLDDTLKKPVNSLDDALTHVAAANYADARSQALRRVRGAGHMTLDCMPAQLPIALVNRYLEVKRAGRL
jgi:uncharacterized protein (DUF58 family)